MKQKHYNNLKKKINNMNNLKLKINNYKNKLVN